MRILELDRTQCEAVLGRAETGRLACARDNQPYIVPIHFYFDLGGNCLFGFSTEGQKIRWMRENPKVCVEVAEVVDEDHWVSVVAFGRYEELDTASGASARALAFEQFRNRAEWWFPAAAKIGSREPGAMVIYRIHIDRMTGRRASRDRS